MDANVIAESVDEKWSEVDTSLRWSKSAESSFIAIMHSSDDHAKSVCRVCCAVATLIAGDFIVTSERVQEGMAAYRALKSRVQPFSDYGVTVDVRSAKATISKSQRAL